MKYKHALVILVAMAAVACDVHPTAHAAELKQRGVELQQAVVAEFKRLAR